MEPSDFKDKSNLAFDLWLSKRNALEKLKSRQLIAHEGHLFRADPSTICFVRTMKNDYPQGFSMLDCNENPYLVSDPDHFLQCLLERHQESVNEYMSLYKQWQSKNNG
jgi:hypothetical protein